MICRIRFDIDAMDLLYGFVASAGRNRPAVPQRELESKWRASGDGLACLSVRSCLDLALRALELPRGAEVIVSAVTIPHVLDILRHHQLVPVPVDLDSDTLAPIRSIEDVVTARSCAVVVAHLFGTRMPMQPICDVARRHGLVVIEDCAQAFDGLRYQGHADADVSMFSFGSIKHCTCFGGALARVRSPTLLSRMRELQAAYPVQAQPSYLAKLVRYSLLALLSTRLLYTLLVLACRALRMDYDAAMNGVARGFKSGDLIALIRRQPCAGLLRVMRRRLERIDEQRQGKHRARCRALVAALLPDVPHFGWRSPTHTFWLFPIRVHDPEGTLLALRRAGFDATRHQSALVVVPPPPGRPAASAIARDLSKILYVPVAAHVTDREVARLADVVRNVARNRTLAPLERPLLEPDAIE